MKKYYVSLITSLLIMSSLPTLATDVIPKGWFKTGSAPAEYSVGIDRKVTVAGNKSVFIEADSADSKGFATLMQDSGVENYRGKRVQLTMHIKSQDVVSWAGGWFRINGAQNTSLAFDNMSGRPVKKTIDWTKYTLVLDVPEEAISMAYGMLLHGNGKVWFDSLRFDIVDKNTPVTDLYVKKTNDKKPKNLSFENDE